MGITVPALLSRKMGNNFARGTENEGLWILVGGRPNGGLKRPRRREFGRDSNITTLLSADIDYVPSRWPVSFNRFYSSYARLEHTPG